MQYYHAFPPFYINFYASAIRIFKEISQTLQCLIPFQGFQYFAGQEYEYNVSYRFNLRVRCHAQLAQKV